MMPDKIYDVVLTGHGCPEMPEWRANLPVPAPGESDVIVRLSAAGVNYSDINTKTA